MFYSVLLNLYMQYKWSRDLRTRFDESQALLGKLKLTCEERVLGKELEALLQVFEPRYEKTGFCILENKDADQLRGNSEADQRICFATRIVQSLCFLNPIQVSIRLLWLYSPVCIGPCRKPRRPVFSQRGSFYTNTT